MKELMDRWRLVLKEAQQEDDRKRLLGVEVEAEEDEFEVGDDVSITVLDAHGEDIEDEELDEWKAEDDADYPSRKRRKGEKYMLKPEKGSWVPGARELATGGLTKGFVGLNEKKPRKKQCHAYNPSHGEDGKFVDPDKEKGSSSMKSPDAGSPDDCTWGQNRRNSANRSTQSTKRPCGRKGPYVCKDGSKKYEEQLVQLEELMSTELTTEGRQEQFEAYIGGIISKELERAVQKHMQGTGCSFNQLVRAMTVWSQAEDGGPKK